MLQSKRPGFSGDRIVLLIAAGKLTFHLLTASRYGVFRDELYYLACAEHLDWGYVDQPPLITLLTWLVTHVSGTSLVGLRLLPALAGAALVWLTGLLAKEVGGGRWAQVVAAGAVALAPIYLLMHHWMTMNAFEPLLWMGCAWCVLRSVNTANPRYWIGFGALAGVGMETKYSMAFFVAAVLVGLLATPHRKALKSASFWIGALVAFIIFLPNFVWLVRYDFPFLELMDNVRRSGRDVVRGPIAFVADQTMILNPVVSLLWVAGVVWSFFAPSGRHYRVLGWIYTVLLVMFIAMKGKNYYLAPAYPMLFAAGATAFERLSTASSRVFRTVYVTAMLIAGVALAPLVSPILSVESAIRYQSFFGLEPIRAENQRTGRLPQYFADEFGWEEMTREVAQVYDSLTPEERVSTAIFANNYGEAGAIDFFGPRYGLPKAISNHQSYWLWGPREYSGETVIVLGSDGTGDRQNFRDVQVGGRVQHPYSRLDEQFDIFLGRGLKVELRRLWPEIKKWN